MLKTKVVRNFLRNDFYFEILLVYINCPKVMSEKPGLTFFNSQLQI